MPGEFHFTGTAAQLVADGADSGTAQDELALSGLRGQFVPNTPRNKPIPYDGGLLWLTPRDFTVGQDGQFYEVLADGTTSATPGITLTANDPDFELSDPLQWRCVLDVYALGGRVIKLASWWFDAPQPGWAGTIAELTPVPGISQTGSIRGARGKRSRLVQVEDGPPPLFRWQDEDGQFWGPTVEYTVTGVPGDTDDLSDAQPYGKALLRAITQAAARAAINALGPDEIAAAIADALASAGAVTAAVAAAVPAAVTAEIAGRSLVNGQPVMLDTVAFAIVDNANRQALAVFVDGSTRIYRLDPASISDGSLTAVKLSPSLQSQLVAPGIGPMLDTIADTSGYLWAIVDSVGRIALGVKTDGSVVGKISATAVAPKLLPEISGTTPNRKLWALNHTTGTRTLITDVNDPREPVEDQGAILFTDNAGRKARLGDGTTMPAYPNRAVVACWGDSWTEGSATPWWPAQLDSLISASVVNLGKSGQTADEIAVRQGGYVLQLSVAGSSIPASGSVTATSSQGFFFRTDNPWAQLGTLAGVPGTLSRASGDPLGQFTFTRTTSGSAVAVAGTTPFSSADAVSYESNLQILFAGRNDVLNYSPDIDVIPRIVAAYDAMVARIRAYHKEFLIFGTINGSSAEGLGSYYWMRVTGINNALADKYGNRFVDLRQYVNQQVIYDLGITPTSGDLSNMAADMPPPSIMANTGHWNQAAALKTAETLIKPKLDQLGWTL